MNNISNSFIIFGLHSTNLPDTEVKKTILKNCNRTIYDKLYIDEFDKIANYSYSFIKDYEEAYNITNDSFMSLWENRNNIDWNKSVVPWLLFVAKNKSINYLRKKTHSNTYKNFSTKEKIDYINYLTIQSDVPQKMYEKELYILLSKAMLKMKPTIRDAFIMSRIKGMKYSEIAHVNNISHRTVEVRIKSAMLILRKFFKDYLM